MDSKYGKCKYGEREKVDYYNIEKGQSENYYCLSPACSARGLCEFHDKEYAESNADKVMELFNKWIKDELTASHSIYCIGFYFPTRVNFQDFQFENNISFSYAEFKGGANFSDTEFRSITQFTKSDFEGEIEFDGTKFPSYQQDYKTDLVYIIRTYK